jgi:hypothetical protein
MRELSGETRHSMRSVDKEAQIDADPPTIRFTGFASAWDKPASPKIVRAGQMRGGSSMPANNSLLILRFSHSVCVRCQLGKGGYVAIVTGASIFLQPGYRNSRLRISAIEIEVQRAIVRPGPVFCVCFSSDARALTMSSQSYPRRNTCGLYQEGHS